MENTKKRILVTGKNSYVGTSFKKWVEQWPDQYEVDMISVRGEEWREYDFSSYDSVLHVAGIAHVSTDPKMEELYYKVNRDLTIEVAKKAKADGVGQFIFMSSIIVYGDSGKIGENKVISQETVPQPTNFYGRSKLEAEEGILLLNSKEFNVAIIRPPMIYGVNSKGNYSKLNLISKWSPLFPSIENQRSMLYIDNLSEFLRLIVINNDHGTYFPQNSQTTRTSEMVYLISKAYGKSIRMTKLFNPLLKILAGRINFLNKLFGNLVYELSISNYKDHYQLYSMEESINMIKVENSR